MRKEEIDREIKHLEDMIRERAKTAHFGSTQFSEFYDSVVSSIDKLKKEKDGIERSEMNAQG